MSSSVSHVLQEAREVLQCHWGFGDFRPGQEEAIEAALTGRDALVILPTGGGKSVCYQVPAVVQEGLTLVISPLIALMHDQVAGLRARGISAAFINSTLSRPEIDQRWTNAEFGQYDLLYVAPERLTTDVFQARAERLDVTLVAVDEAHCVSEWGHHFRPDYLKIPEARALLDDPPTIAVTATATPAVRRDILKHLHLHEPAQIVHGFDRPNIVWSVFRRENKRAKVRDIVESVEGSGIVYAATRRHVEQWTDWLRDQNIAAAPYHGGMASERREEVQHRWIEDEVRLIVATNAFGMGIDKPDVRFVIHVDLPASLEAYYQEAGRAGRDGKTAYAVLLFQPSDADTQQALIESSHPSASDVQKVYDAVCNIGQVPIGSEPDGPLAINYEAVMRLTGFSRAKVRTAVELLERQEAWQVLPWRKHYGLFRFTQPAGTVRRYAQSRANEALARFVRTVLRTVHADAFSDWHTVDLRLLERRSGLSRERLQRGLDFLQDHGLIDWRAPGRTLYVQLAMPRARKIPVDGRAVRRARRRAERRLNYMLRYARSVTCRRHFLLTYFGEASPSQCGTCDVCLGRHQVDAIMPEDEPTLRRILQCVEEGMPRDEWFDAASPPAHRIDGLVDWLMQNGYLQLDEPFEGQFAVTDKARQRMKKGTSRSA